MKKKIIEYSITSLFGLGLAFLAFYLRDGFTETSKVLIYRYLADSFTIPGLFLVLLGVMVWLSNEGAFDGIGYMLKRLGQALLPFGRKTDQKYSDYVSSRKRVSGYSFIFYTGFVFCLAAIVFIILFYTVY